MVRVQQYFAAALGVDDLYLSSAPDIKEGSVCVLVKPTSWHTNPTGVFFHRCSVFYVLCRSIDSAYIWPITQELRLMRTTFRELSDSMKKYEFNVVGATHADIVSADQRRRRLIMICRDGSLGRWWGICSHSVSLGDGGSVGGSYVSPRGFPPSGQGERGMGGGGEIGWGARWRWSVQEWNGGPVMDVLRSDARAGGKPGRDEGR